ncbi:MAG: adenosine deaminase [Woeseiaceae bacterium]|nr:adenosine deaminase [Woeseiaceae bacterium]
MDWFDKVPKTEIHLHLEGAIPHAVLWELVQKYGGDPSVPSLEDLRAKFEYRDFPHFLETWTWMNGYLREYADFAWIAEGVARDLAKQNIRYAEAHFSPSDFTQHGLETQQIAKAIRAGLDEVEGVEVALIADLVRNYGPEQAQRTLNEVNEVKEAGVIGIGLGGAEHQFPAKLFVDAFEAARELGFRTTAHAGEGAGAESVRSAIDDLQVERIGHGVRAIEDECLLAELAARRIPLEVCPISNVRTGVVASLSLHPVRQLHDRGCLVTVNTDDPKMFGNSLAEEYRLLERDCGFSREEIRGLIRNGVQATWMNDAGKRCMLESLENDAFWTGHADNTPSGGNA